MISDYLRKHNTKMENIIDWILLWTGVVSTFLGTLGTAMLAFSMFSSDRVMTAVFAFISIYMLFFGMFLIFYHKKIIYKPKPHSYY